MPEPDDAAEDAWTASPAALLEETAEELYEEAPCGYLSTLPDGTIVRVNGTFLRWTGYRREDLVGRRRLQDLLTAGGRIYYETHYAPLLAMQGSVREIALEVACPGGRTLPALLNTVVRRDAAGRAVLARTTVYDVTERRRYEQELLRARRGAEEAEARARQLARTLQASLIPPAPPQIPGLELAAVYRPAGKGDEVGGDFYDVFETRPGEWAVVVGDVAGKGAEAAAVTALARYTVRAAAIRARRPRVVLATLNEALLRDGSERFCTVVYARVRPDPGPAATVTVASGGHPLPLLVPSGGEPVEVGRPGDLLGPWGEPVLHDVAVPLRAGDAIVFFTDGVTEGRREGDLFGEGRLHDLLRGRRGSAEEIAALVVDSVVGFQDGSPRDDVAVVVLRVPDPG